MMSSGCFFVGRSQEAPASETFVLIVYFPRRTVHAKVPRGHRGLNPSRRRRILDVRRGFETSGPGDVHGDARRTRQGPSIRPRQEVPSSGDEPQHVSLAEDDGSRTGEEKVGSTDCES